MATLIVIPARWGSSRFPGKPLAVVAGVTLIERTIHLARSAAHGIEGVRIVVATDDSRIADVARARCETVMTDPAITTGSGRALKAATMVGPVDHVVNLQGDAPLLPAAALTAVVRELKRRPAADCVTPVVQLDWTALDLLREHKLIAPFSGTTCLRGRDCKALWFSKQIVPTIRDEAARRRSSPLSPVFRHLGLYGYSLGSLARFDSLPVSFYEQCEGLEQLRMIEAGMNIHTVEIDPALPTGNGIDTIEDLRAAEIFIARHGDPYRR